MIPHKCNFIIFSQNPQEREVLQLSLFDSILTTFEDPTFLSIRFDKTLTYKNQINNLKESCLNRLKTNKPKN